MGFVPTLRFYHLSRGLFGMKRSIRQLVSGLVVLGFALCWEISLRANQTNDTPAKLPVDLPAEHQVKAVQGWSVKVDTRLLEPQHQELANEAIECLDKQLFQVRRTVEPSRLAKLQRVTIWLDLTYDTLTSEQYHVSPEWLKGQGYPTELAGCIHIPQAAYFSDKRHQHEQPWAIMHELAHAYHDQELTFDHPPIVKAWEEFKANPDFAKVLHVNGSRQPHYATTNHHEFFAEMSEAYLGTNDFFPFNNAELKTSLPPVHELMQSVWGPVP